jgi:AraC-like DNA-binding protein
VHTGTSAVDGGWSYRMLYPSESLVRFITREATGRDFAPTFDTSCVRDSGLADRIRSAHMVLESEADDLQKECALVEVVGEIVIRHGSSPHRSTTPLPAPRSTAALRRVRDLLEAEYARTVTIRELADEAGLSTFHLIRVFRAMFGLPPYKYLEQIRIQQARRLIRHGFPLTQVVHATGFSDQSHLTRYFKRIVGVTPGSYARGGAISVAPGASRKARKPPRIPHSMTGKPRRHRGLAVARRLAGVTPTLALAVSVGSSLRAQATTGSSTAEEKAVLATVQRLFDAMRAKDTSAFRAIFEPNATLVGMRTRQTGEQVVQVLPWDRFAAFMAADQRGPWIERAWSPEVRVRGTLATVWAEYDFHFGQTPSHCGVDAVQLLKTPSGWKIVSIADTYEPTGCPKRDPPR